MINQPLLDYIKQQLQQGVSREQIKSSLLTNAWEAQDIDEGFNTIDVSFQSGEYSNFLTKAPTKIWKIILVSVVGVLFIIGGVYFVSQKFFQPIEKPVEKFQLDLNIITPKDTYKIDEVFKGDYLLKYEGPSFKGIVAYNEYKKGVEERGSHSVAIGTIKTGDFDSELSILRQALTPFILNATDEQKDSFHEAGEYVYTMSVYKCDDVGLKQNCDTRAATPELLSNFQPLATVSKVILVTNGDSKDILPTLIQKTTEKTILDCVGIEDPQCTLKFLDLFKQNLQSCKVSKGTTLVGWEPAMGLFRGYEILGIQNNLCVINFWFLKTKDTPVIILDKQMTCKYSVSERTIEKVAKAENCTGPLLEEMNKLLK